MQADQVSMKMQAQKTRRASLGCFGLLTDQTEFSLSNCMYNNMHSQEVFAIKIAANDEDWRVVA